MLADGWGYSQMQNSNSLKMSIIGGIHAVHYFRGGCGMLGAGRGPRACVRSACRPLLVGARLHSRLQA
jgi:hypothetical protein